MSRKIVLIIVLLALSLFFVWMYDKKNTTDLSVEFDVSTKDVPTQLAFEVEDTNIYKLKIDFKNKVGEKATGDFYSMPLTFSLKLIKDGSEVLIDDIYTINGISGENKDRTIYREINNILYEKGKYVVIVAPIEGSPSLNSRAPKLTISRAN